MLTEAELNSFIERLDAFTAGLSLGEQQFLTGILLRAVTSQATDMSTHHSHPDSVLHARLTHALWESDRAAGSWISLNPLPIPPPHDDPLAAGE